MMKIEWIVTIVFDFTIWDANPSEDKTQVNTR